MRSAVRRDHQGQYERRNPTTRAVMFHLGKYIPQGVPDTYGFNGIDASQCTGDTIALTYPSGISGLVLQP